MKSTLKSDNASAVGVHCFEHAGLGLAPFRVVGYTTSKHQDAPGAPVRPGTSCDYCSTAIMYVCLIQDKNGKQFKVGCDCVERTGDAGMIRAYKSTPEYRKHQKDLRQAKDKANDAELRRLLADDSFRALLTSKTFVNSRGETTNRLDGAEKSLPWCGAAGRAQWLACFRKVLAGKL